MWAFAWQNLLSRPMRSLLALLGLTVAIAGMVGLFSVAAGLQATVERTFNRIPGVVAMQPGTAIPLFSKLPTTWADEIAGLPGVRGISKEVWSRANLVEGQPTFYPPRLLFGADLVAFPKLQTAVYRDDMVAGRFLEPADAGLPYCVISRQVAGEYQKEPGSTLRVDGHDLQIIGIYETNSMLLDVAIITSSETARRMAQIDDAVVSSVYIEPDGSLAQTELIEAIRQHFHGRQIARATNPLASAQQSLADLSWNVTGRAAKPQPEDKDADEAIEVHSTMEWGQRIQKFGGEIDIFLVIMNAIGVLIALFSIINTMLMSVTERLTEFGVLRANGWSSRDVMQLILGESALLGLAGGILGCGVGYVATLIVNSQFPAKLNLYASPSVLLMSLCFSVVIGTLGGLYPAWWSVRQSPMEAIRRS